ncbi:MAG: hypothetical protein FJ386_11085 [Verrucomicrobia bacterium]|nr:hypothetical protein [Verrucomicrobiota bacterium]
MKKVWIPLLLLAWVLGARAGEASRYAEQVAPLIDPAKLATLRERGANPRVQKYVAQLAEAKQAGLEVSNVVVQAVALVGMKGGSRKAHHRRDAPQPDDCRAARLPRQSRIAGRQQGLVMRWPGLRAKVEGGSFLPARAVAGGALVESFAIAEGTLEIAIGPRALARGALEVARA